MTKKTKKPTKSVIEKLLAADVKAMFPWPEEFKTAKNGSYCGRSQKHWQEQARRLYAECLLRASMLGTNNPVGAMVSKRILAILEREDPEMLQEMIDERARCQRGLTLILLDFASRKDPISQKLQEARVLPRVRRGAR